MQNPTQYPDLNTILGNFVDSLKDILADDLVAVYLQGSFALGDWDEHSDVDFMVVVETDISDDILPQLQAMHQRIFASKPPWSTHLEGSYFPKKLLKRGDPEHTPIWYLDNGATQLIRHAHDNELVVRWVTREYGISLFGDNPKAYIDPVAAGALKAEVKKTMHTWGGEIVRGEYIIENVWAQSFAVISYCRMLQTLKTGAIHSKKASVRWAKTVLDQHWHDLIQSAWDNRPNPSQKVRLAADPYQVTRTIEFIQYALNLSNENDEASS